MDSSDQQSGVREAMPTPKLHDIIFGSLNSEQVDYIELHRLATAAIGNLIDAGSTCDQICEELRTIRVDLDAVEEGCDPKKLRGLYDLIGILVEEIAEKFQISTEIALQKLADVVPIIQPDRMRKSPSPTVIVPKEDERGVQATISNVRSGLRTRLYALLILAGIAAGGGIYTYKNRAGEAETPVAASTAPRVTTPAAAVAPAPQAVPPAAAVAPAPQAVPPAAAPTPQASTPVVASPVPRAKASVAAVPKPRTEIPTVVSKPQTATSVAAPKPRVAPKLSPGTIEIPIVVKPSAASGGFKIDTDAFHSRGGKLWVTRLVSLWA